MKFFNEIYFKPWFLVGAGGADRDFQGRMSGVDNIFQCAIMHINPIKQIG